MIARLLRWQERARVITGHLISQPLHHLFTLVPKWEIGLQTAEISRITCTHSPLAGRRGVQISDLHLDRYQPRHDSLVATIRDLRPDWIFVTGDLLDVRDGLPHLFRFLTALRNLAPVYIILGNHDHYSGVPADDFAALADRHKIVLLLNQATFIPVPDGELAIVGVDDPSLHRADLRCLPGSAEGRFTLLLAHAPSILDQLTDHHETDLILCGHSHGGQWRIPGVPSFWLPPGCNGRLSGFHHRGRHRLYVNRGAGWSVLPIRLQCPSEILVIDWVEAEASPAQRLKAA